MAKIYCKSSYLLRRDTAANWNTKNPILREGEEGYETDTGRRKVGNGTTEWNNLKYDSGIVDQAYSPTSENAQSGKAVAEAVSAEQNRANNTFANALKGSKSGSAILIDDVSPVPHEMGVKVSGKNLFDKGNANILNAYFTASGDVLNTNSKSTRSIWIPCSPNTTYTVSKILSARFAVGFTNSEPMNGVTVNNVTFLSTATKITVTSGNIDKYIIVWFYHSSYDTSVTVEEILASMQIELGTTATSYTPYVPDLTAVKVSRCGKNLFDNNKLSEWGLTLSDGKYTGSVSVLNSKTLFSSFKSNTRYTISVKASNASKSRATLLIIINYTDGTTQTVIRVNSTTESVYSFTSTANKSISNIASTYYDIDTINIAYIQIEEGTIATEYEPYKGADYTPTADGTVEGVTSLYPNTALMTDTDGVIIDCEYNRDINKFSDVYVKHTDINQTYSPTSENAQSGKAVAEAIAQNTYTKISKIEISVDDFSQFDTSKVYIAANDIQIREKLSETLVGWVCTGKILKDSLITFDRNSDILTVRATGRILNLVNDKLHCNADFSISLSSNAVKLKGINYFNPLSTDSTYDANSDNPQSGKAVAEALSGYVVAEVGKGLSSNDFTNEDKEKLYSALQNENIDQTYSPTSANAQSGKAVAEAIYQLNHERYFDIDDTGLISLKVEYRGAHSSTWDKYIDTSYCISDNGAGVVGSKNSALPSHLTIPTSITRDGVEIKVLRLAEGMFSGNPAIKELTIPEYITVIPACFCIQTRYLSFVHNTEHIDTVGDRAFNQSGLIEANFPSATSIGTAAFRYCWFLKKADIGNTSVIEAQVFQDDTNLCDVICKAPIQSIGKNAFYQTEKLKSLPFQESITTIGNTAFKRSAINYDFSSLTASNLGTNSVPFHAIKGMNKTDFWSGASISASKKNLLTVTFNQKDPRWIYELIDPNKTHSDYVGGSGCVFFALMEAYCGMNDRYDLVTMQQLQQECVSKNALSYFEPSLTDTSQIINMANALGITATSYTFTKDNLQTLYNAISNGSYAIIEVPNTANVYGGHAVLAYGVDAITQELLCVDTAGNQMLIYNDTYNCGFKFSAKIQNMVQTSTGTPDFLILTKT